MRGCKLTWLQTNDAQQVAARVLNLERYGGATYLSLTRTATLSITTAGVVVTWQSEIENVGEWTWSATAITVPVAGYYAVTVIGSLAIRDNIHGDLRVNSVEVCSMGTGAQRDVKFRHTVTRFFKAGDVVQYRAHTTTGTHTLQVVTEDVAGESPIFHMVML